MRALAPILVAFLIALAGCDIIGTGTNQPGTGAPGSVDANFNPNNATQETGDSNLKTFASADELKDYLASMATSTTSYRNGDATFAGEDADTATAAPESSTGDAGDSSNGATGGGEPAPAQATDDESFSDTTTQEAGVQEADIIKNDGSYIYVLTDSALRVARVNPGEEMDLLATQPLDGWGRELYKLPDDAAVATRIVAITQLDSWYVGIPEPDVFVTAQRTEYYRPQTVVTILDVSDHENPAVQSEVTLDGTAVHSRLIDGALYLVLVNYPEYFIDVLPTGTDELDLDDVDLDAILPGYTIATTNGEPETGNMVDWDGFYRPIDPDGFGMTTIVTMSIDSPQDFNAKTIVAYPGNLYASPQAIYLTDTDYNYYTGDYREQTDIYKFGLTESSVDLVATGTVEGRILNQYSMSEYEGYLRVATTTSGFWFGDEATPSVNNLYVLQENDEALEVVGSIEDLAPGEQIYSARFIGPRGYLVTFEQIDPLFTFDLSNPANPVKVGELKVPGYSSFIVPMGDNHLLTIGRDVMLDAGWPMPVGVQLSVFDITDFADPQLLHKEVIGGEETYSEAIHNPKAFTYFAAKDLLAVPIEVYDWGWGWEEDGEGTATSTDVADSQAAKITPDPGFNGVFICRVTPAEGFVHLGQMSTRFEEDDYYWGSWFTRGVFMDDNCYAVTERGIVGAPLSDVTSAPWRIVFPPEEQPTGNGGEPVPSPDEPTTGGGTASSDGGEDDGGEGPVDDL